MERYQFMTYNVVVVMVASVVAAVVAAIKIEVNVLKNRHFRAADS